MQVIREVYLPQSGLWLAEYPFVDRGVFLDLSLNIERARQMMAPPPGPGAGPGPAPGPGAGAAPGAGPTGAFPADGFN